jgi:hypothetical protein
MKYPFRRFPSNKKTSFRFWIKKLKREFPSTYMANCTITIITKMVKKPIYDLL